MTDGRHKDKRGFTLDYFANGKYGAGWYYWPTEYPEEGKCGPFDIRGEAMVCAVKDFTPSGVNPKPQGGHLRELLDQATKRPWRFDMEVGDAAVLETGDEFYRMRGCDCRLIVAAVNALSYLLDRIDSLENAARSSIELAECAGSAPRAAIVNELKRALEKP